MQAIDWQTQRTPDGAPVHHERTDRSRPRCTAWCSSTPPPSSSRLQAAAGADLPQFVKDEFDAVADRATQAGDAGAAGGAPSHHAPTARAGRSQGRAGRQRRGHADPAELVDGGFSGQSEHPPPLPGAGRRVPVRHRRRTCLRRSARADRRGAAGGVAQDHHPIDASCSPVGGCSSKSRARPPWPTTTATRTRPAYSGHCRPLRVLAASPLAHAPARGC